MKHAMPLHDGSELTNWETVHTYWIVELGHWLKPRLPAGYRVSLGTIPARVRPRAPSVIGSAIPRLKRDTSWGSDAVR
jgi:hypothetical protein